MGVKSRRKGVKGEREVARKLYEVWVGVPPPPDREIFVRTKIGVRQRLGDIVVPDDFPFVVEVKNRNLPLSSVVDFTSQFHRLVDETITKLQNGGKDICLAVKVGKPSKFYFFVITKERPTDETCWVRKWDDDHYILWFTEETFLKILKSY